MTRIKLAKQNWLRMQVHLAKLAAMKTPKPDALEKAMEGVAPDYSTGSPLGPGWRTPEQYAHDRLVSVIIADYQDGMVPPADLLGAYSRDGQEVRFPSGERVLIHDLIDAQRLVCFDLLKQRVDPKAIAAILMRPVDWVAAIRAEFQIH